MQELRVHLVAGEPAPADDIWNARWSIDSCADAQGAPPWSAVVAGNPRLPPPAGTVVSYRAHCVVGKAGPAGGVSLLALCTALPGLSRDAVFRHWAEHIPLAVLIHHGALNYRQYRFLERVSAAGPNLFGMACLGFVDAAAIAGGLFRSEADMPIIAADVAEFVQEATTLIAREL